jgi:hypothetical protein
MSVNPYAAGVAPAAAEPVEPLHWTSKIGYLLAAISAFCFLALVGYIATLVSGAPQSAPNTNLVFGLEGVAWFGSLAGTIFAAIGMRRTRARRGARFFSLLVNVLVFIVLTSLAVLGMTMRQ